MTWESSIKELSALVDSRLCCWQAEEAREHCKACQLDVGEKRVEMANTKSEIITQIREMVSQCDLTLKAVSVDLSGWDALYLSYRCKWWMGSCCLLLFAGDGQLVSAPASPGCLSSCKQPESVWKCQTVRARPALHWVCQESTHWWPSPGVPLIWLSSHTEHRVRPWAFSKRVQLVQSLAFILFQWLGGVRFDDGLFL